AFGGEEDASRRSGGGDDLMSRLMAKTYVQVRVRADGPTKVLELLEQGGDDGDDDDDEDDPASVLSLPHFGAGGGTGGSMLSLSHRGGGGRDTVVATARSPVLTLFMAQAYSLGVSVVDDAPKEVLYVYLEGLKFAMTKTREHRTASLTVEGLQV
ncbi:unnamed protein product, partial [Phaeothamnion confervicola]